MPPDANAYAGNQRSGRVVRPWTLTSAVAGAVIPLASCAHAPSSVRPDPAPGPGAASVVIASPAGRPRPPFTFSADENLFLDEVQRGAFNYLWDHAGSTTGMVADRSSTTVVSIAGVGFQLSAIPIAVEHGWISNDAGRARSLLILRSLAAVPENRHEGLFFHYLDPDTAAPSRGGYERVVSTIDSALLFAGMITASSYFGGDVAAIADSLVGDANWNAFAAPAAPKEPWYDGLISLGWDPGEHADAGGAGRLLPYYWADAGDEQRLVYFLAACAPRDDHRAAPDLYYRLHRKLGVWNDEPVSWFPWSGALFTAFFAHGWIDYAAMPPDRPADHGQSHRASIDWWENSRRLVNMHRDKARLNPFKFATIGENSWGLSASDAPKGYSVPGLFPTPARAEDGARPLYDFAAVDPPDNWEDGTIAPYAAGCSIIFEPQAALRALKHYRSLAKSDGSPLLWSDPASGGIGFADAFNLENGWVASDAVAIDQGPLILSIENARTGLIWRLFRAHPFVRGGMERLGLPRAR